MHTQLDKNAINLTLESWVSLNTGTDNLTGLALFKETLANAFSCLNAKIETIDLPDRIIVNDLGEILSQPVGKALSITKREHVRPRVLLVGHMDTVFSVNSPFQSFIHLDPNRLKGPGACDMKGGILILLESLKLWEASPDADKLGWQVILTPDEEVGSPSSKALLTQAATQANVGLIFEPAFPNGHLVSTRKGSATLTLIARGIAAHAGRDFHKGRSAIVAMSRFIAEADLLNKNDVTINFGHFVGGKATNIVPDLAVCRVGIRADTLEGLETTLLILKKMGEEREFPIEVVVHTTRPPKLFNKTTEKLFEEVGLCGEEMNLSLAWEPSGGVCDGNFLAAAGLPTIDTLGTVGGDIHTFNEYVELDSIPQRIELTYRLLKRIAQNG